MTEAKHTAGPWHVEECEQCPERGRIYIHAKGWLDPNELIGEARRTDRDVDDGSVKETEANARLIAAAPDLKAFAELVVHYNDKIRDGKVPTQGQWDMFVKQARAALAKAGDA